MADWQIRDERAAALIRSGPNRVEMWTTRRLPYQPRGALLETRNYLVSRLVTLVASSDDMLEARYLSTLKEFVDTENVLIYNVCTSAFRSSARFGLRFIREFDKPPPAPIEVWEHYHCYELVPWQGLSHTCSKSTDFQFHLARLTTSLKTHDYWWAAKAGLVDVEDFLDRIVGPFQMTIEIIGPLFRSNPAALVKPLFDGLISALHCDPDIEAADPVVDRIAAKLKLCPSQVAESLRNSSHAILGKRKLVRPTKTFVAWNPADERCLRGELLVRNRDSTTWSIDVSVSPVDDRLQFSDDVL